MLHDSQLTQETKDRQIRIESLGRLVDTINQAEFMSMLRGIQWIGAIDITDWTLSAIIALIAVISEENKIITLKQKNRFFMPIRYPRGQMIELFAKAIFLGEL